MVREFRSFALLICAFAGTPVSSVADESGPFSVPLVAQSSGAFYVRGTLGGVVSSELLVDTGSSYVLLSRKTFDALRENKLTTYLRSIRGATANGRVVKAKVYEVSELALGENCTLKGVEVVMLPGSDRDILGLSALKRVQPFTFDLDPLALRFDACR